jgi:hypothetical protein
LSVAPETAAAAAAAAAATLPVRWCGNAVRRWRIGGIRDGDEMTRCLGFRVVIG